MWLVTLPSAPTASGVCVRVLQGVAMPPPECFALVNEWADQLGPFMAEAITASTETGVFLGLAFGFAGYVLAEGFHRGCGWLFAHARAGIRGD